MTRRFVLVTAAYTDQNWRDSTASGIRKLKRGVSLRQFIADFMTTMNLDEKNSVILARGDTYVLLAKDNDLTQNESGPIRGAASWNFTEFPEDDLFSAVAHLTKEELLRDLKELLPLKARA